MTERATVPSGLLGGVGRELRAVADPRECLAGGGRMAALMRSTDWASTPLGSVATWPQSLRTSVSICLGTSFPMMIAWGPELHMLYNDGYLPVLGSQKHPAALGQPLLECFSEIRDLLGAMFGGVMATGEPVGAEDMMFPIERHGYPEETYFVFSYSPIRDETGRVGGVLTTCTETTQRVIGERRLRTLRALAEGAARAVSAEDALERVAATLDPADTPFALLYLVDADGDAARLVATSGIPADSPACVGTIRLDREDPAPWPLSACASTRRPEVLRDVDARLGPLPGGRWPEPTTEAVVLPVARPGQTHPYGFLVAGVSPRRALDDGYRGYLELVADHVATAVANARAREEERRRAEVLAELDRAKTEFFSNVSHEFRTPLTLMLGPLEDLLAGRYGEAPDGMREPLDVAHRNALRLLKLVNSLLDFARTEAGRIRAVYEPVDLAAVTADIASGFRSAIERAGLRFTVSCPPVPAPVHVDVEMWEKVVLNLLSNALKFTFEGEISISLASIGDCVELEVRDTGIGIARHELPNLFVRFHRIHGARSRTHEGSGIGLALVQELVRLHGGDVRCESEPGRGSAFKARIRTGTAHLPSERIGTARDAPSTAIGAEAFVAEATRWIGGDAVEVRAPAEQAAPSSTRATPGARVLVADDNADMRDYLCRLLGAYWSVDAARDGQVALEAARRDPPDLVLADVMMPVLDGFALLRELRRDDRTRHVPVVLVSARAGEDSRIEGLDAGADDYLVKPFSARELVARVNAHVSLARARRAIESQRAMLDVLFQQMPAAVSITCGPDFVYEMVNDHFLAVSGKTRGEVIGRPALELFPELRGQGFEEMAGAVLAGGAPAVGREVPVRVGPDAGSRFWNFVLAPVPDESGRVERLMSFSYEVTTEVVARHRSEALAVELQATVAARDETVAQLQTILATVPIGLAFFDREVRFVRVNDDLARLNGVPVDGMVGSRARAVVPADLAPLVEQNVGRVFDTGASVGPIEASVSPHGGEGVTGHWLLTWYPLADPAGGVRQVGLVVVDVTSQRTAELDRSASLERERLARQEADLQRAHLHALFMQAPTPICILRGERFVIELVNERCCEVWGRRHEDVVARPLFEALPEVESQVFNDLLRTVLATGEPVVGKEVPAELGPAGHRRTVYFNFVYAPMRDAANRVAGVLVIASDVTDEIRARNELSRTLHYNEMFVGIVGHDLRNPLGSITTGAQLLLRRSREERIAAPAARILDSSERMSRMVEQLLDFTRIRIGRGLGIQSEPFDLADVLRRVVAEVEAARGGGRRFDVQTQGDARGEWDADRLAQVFSNLAGNAVDHSKGDRLRVVLDAGGSDGITITFANDGEVPPALLPELFEPFRGARIRGRNASGLGLGLYITREIVTAHGGDIQVSSAAGETRFTVVLPRQTRRSAVRA